MSIEIRVDCDVEGCDAYFTVGEDRWSMGTIVDPAAGFVLDTEWIGWPKGWRAGDDDLEYCPEHAEMAG